MWPVLLAIGWMAAIAVIAAAVRRTGGHLPNENISTMGVLAAGIFVAQMLNFPILGGTTGHLVGATIATLMVGPWAAIIVMSVVIIIQGFMFGDGGILAMGLNLTNMAVVGVGISWVVISAMKKVRTDISVLIAAWSASLIAAFVCALELAISYSAMPGTYGIVWYVSIPAMLGAYAMIGVGEAVITSAVVIYFAKVAPEILHSFGQRRTEVIGD